MTFLHSKAGFVVVVLVVVVVVAALDAVDAVVVVGRVLLWVSGSDV